MYRTKSSCERRQRISNKSEFAQRHSMFYSMDALSEHIERTYTPPVRATKIRKSSLRNDDPSPCAHLFTSPIYQNIDKEAILTTLRYLYERHRKAVYVSIRNGKLLTYAQFVNNKYINPLAKYMDVDREKTTLAIRKFYGDPEHPVAFHPASRWRVMNCLIGNALQTPQMPFLGYEPDYNWTEFKQFFGKLCAARRVPDCDFFLNYYDQILLRADRTVPFFHIVGLNRSIDIPEIQGKRMCPILSMSGRDGFLDIPFIFPDDVQRLYPAHYIPRCSNGYAAKDAEFEHRWSKKIGKAVFRGTATGCGFTVETNARMKLLHLAKTRWEKEGLVDVALVGGTSVHFRKHESDTFVNFYQDPRIVQEPDKAMSATDQSKYKYIVYVEGNVVAYRLTNMFRMGSVVVYVEGYYKPWFYPLLLDKVNCLIVPRVANVGRAIRWARANDSACKAIALAGRELYEDHFQRKGLMAYAQDVMFNLNANSVCLKI